LYCLGFNTLCGVRQGGDRVCVYIGINIWNWTWDRLHLRTNRGATERRFSKNTV